MPKVHIIDMQDEVIETKRNFTLSRTMERMLGETLERREQAMILMNRRGFANRLYCPSCKTRIECPNCNVAMVVHSTSGVSICHYCRRRIDTPTHCPNLNCKEPLVQLGSGTQRVEEALHEFFPDARVARVDSDTMTHRDKYQELVDDFEARKIDVLVGTQMIAKGLDFPYVSFVGVIHADPTAMASDFRAHERLFQLITQVAGRAGRADVAGRVVVQTTMPDLPALQCALDHDYEAFASAELAVRTRAGLPPFRRLVRIVLTDVREAHVANEANALADRIRVNIDESQLSHADVLGPNPCALRRIRNMYRYELLIRTAGPTAMRQLLEKMEESGSLRSKARSVMIDVDPVAFT